VDVVTERETCELGPPPGFLGNKPRRLSHASSRHIFNDIFHKLRTTSSGQINDQHSRGFPILDMARLRSPSFPLPGAAIRTDPLADLNRLLSRLDQTINHATAEQERRLRRDEYERTRVRYDIDAARTALIRIEQDGYPAKTHARRHDGQHDLGRQRELIEHLLERVQDLEDAAAAADNDDADDDDSSDGEDILADIIQTPSESMDSRSTGGIPADEAADDDAEAQNPSRTRSRPPVPPGDQSRKPEPSTTIAPPSANGALSAPPARTTTTSNTLRSRGKPPHPSPEKQAAGAEKDKDEAIGQTTARQLLFGDRSPGEPASAAAGEEALLDRHQAEQEALTEDMLRLARALKARTLETGQQLEEDGRVLGRVGQGLDTTDAGMAAAGKRMSSLARMAEGKGWWGRMMLFAMVWGMMVLLVLLFVLLPKLRF